MATGVGTIEVIRGEIAAERADALVEFLSREGSLNQEAARRFVSEGVCAALDDGEVIGVNAVRRADVQLLGGRPLWVHRSVLASDSDELWTEMFNSAFAVLAGEFEATGGTGCIGVCALIGEAGREERRPEALWPEEELMFAGWLEDGRQVRVRYFWGAAIGPSLPNSPPLDETRHHRYPLGDRYRITSVGDDGVTPDDVLRFWAREGAVGEEEAQRRVREVQLVGIDRANGVVAVSSVYLRRNPQLRMDLWHYRTYVGREHRHSNLAAQLIFRNRDLKEKAFVDGEDRRGVGMLFELENEGMKRYFNKALWLPADFTFIGENEKGDHVRVHYFPGATVPVPEAELRG